MNEMLETVLNYNEEELNHIAKVAKMDLSLTVIPDDYPEGDFTHETCIMFYLVERDYMHMIDDYNNYLIAIQDNLRELAVKIYALTYGTVSIDSEILQDLQDMVAGKDMFVSLRHMALPETLSFWDNLGFTEDGVVGPLIHDPKCLPTAPRLFVSFNKRDVSSINHRATLFRRCKRTNFSLSDVDKCHTDILDALCKCKDTGSIFVYDTDGNFIESFGLQDSNSFERINMYVPDKYKLSESEMKACNMEIRLSQDVISAKKFYKHRYNSKTAFNDFMVVVNVHTKLTRLMFTKDRKYDVR